MFLRLLGVLDVLSGVVLILLRFKIATSIAWFFAIYLIIKGLIFIVNLVSIFDIATGVVMIFAIYGSYNIITWLFVIWISQKGLATLAS
ncbi:MAG: hypothetical protein NT139_00400 [Candidatus Woesearchaeota archaeon]|nr:hypothetical protein [Candidatus Woesearchaeota archaeon]